MYQLRLLWSINDRLGGGPGKDYEEPTMHYVDDLLKTPPQHPVYQILSAFFGGLNKKNGHQN